VNNTIANPVKVPVATTATTLATFNKKDIKAKGITLDVVKDNVIPHVSGKDCTFEMWDA